MFIIKLFVGLFAKDKFSITFFTPLKMLEKVGKREKTTDDNYTEFVINFNKQQVLYILVHFHCIFLYIAVHFCIFLYTSTAYCCILLYTYIYCCTLLLYIIVYFCILLCTSVYYCIFLYMMLIVCSMFAL